MERKIVWGTLSDSRVSGILRNPCYAGVYTHGRYGYEKVMSSNGDITLKTVKKSIQDWEVMIKDHHEGYITWDEYQQNLDTLKKNRTNIEGNRLPTSAREGLALLQGLLICKKCGRRITIRYKGNNGCYPWYQCNKLKSEGLSTKECFLIQSTLVDEAVSARITEIVNQKEIFTAIKVYEELNKRSRKVNKQWEMRIQQAEYQSELAQRRYEEVDPSNRLVALTLEKKWNDSLVNLEKAKSKYRKFCDEQNLNDLYKYKSEVQGLSGDFKKLWDSSKTNEKDKKRILRLLIKDITVGEEENNRKKIVLQIRWHGGALEEIVIDRLQPAHKRWEHPPELVERVRKLAETMSDKQIIDVFNEEGIKTNKGNSFTKGVISWIRYKHKIPAAKLRKENELTGKEVMKKFGVSYYVVSYWIERKVVNARQKTKGAPWWITVDPDTEKRLREWIRKSSRIVKTDKTLTKIEGSAL